MSKYSKSPVKAFLIQVFAIIGLLLVSGLSGSAVAQSAAENIQPVGQVCLAGQPCVGQPASSGGMTRQSTPAASAPAQDEATTPAATAPAPARDEPATPAATEPAPAQDEPATPAATAPAPAQDEPATPAAAAPDPAQDEPAPAAAGQADDGFDAAAAYQRSCMACHLTGAANAPKLGDERAWNTRLEKGMDAVMENVIKGMNVMPPRGLCQSCSNEQLRAIVDYMISQ